MKQTKQRKKKQQKMKGAKNNRCKKGADFNFLKYVFSHTKGEEKQRLMKMIIEGVIHVTPHRITEIDDDQLLYDVDDLGIVHLVVRDKDYKQLQDVHFDSCREGLRLFDEYNKDMTKHIHLIVFINDVKEDQTQMIETFQMMDETGKYLPLNIYFVYVPYIDEVVKQKRMRS